MAVTKTEAELEELSLEELRALANGQTEPVVPKVEAKASVVEDEPEEEIEDEEESEEIEDAFVREIDLGDGSGIQVFKAATESKLLDKLAEAQKHATKKIREQASQLTKFKKQADAEAADNEYIYGQELMSKPTEAFKKIFKDTTGVDMDSLKTKLERLEAFDAAQRVQAEESKKNDAAVQFIAAHPEFVANKNNGSKIERAVNLLVADAERLGKHIDHAKFLEEAYADLKESGLLQLKNDDEEEAPKVTITKTKDSATGETLNTATVQVQAHTRRSSGLNSRVRTISTPKSTEPTEDDLYGMSLDQIRELDRKSRQRS